MFIIIINDKNAKFMSKLWKIIIKKLIIIMFIFIVWHVQIDDQSKRTNQIIEITFRFHIISHLNDDWIKILSYFQTKNNNVKQFIIDFAFNEITYDFKVNDNLKMFFDLFSKNFNRLKLIKDEKIEIVMIFVNVINKTRYDLYHKIFDDSFKIDSMMYLRFHQNYTISKLFNKKLFNQKMNSFKTLKIV